MSGPITTREAKSRIPYPCDKVAVKNLQVSANAGIDVWSRPKKQPALISIELSLAKSFKSAAETDQIDDSTVHYGKLSKNILTRIEELSANWMSSIDLAGELYLTVIETAGSEKLLAACDIELTYPKASMLGDGVAYCFCFLTTGVEPTYSRVLHLKNVRVPCLVGINSNERERKQVVVANLWLDSLSSKDSETEVYAKAEDELIQAIEQSAFGTLETLATMVVDRFAQLYDYSEIRLRIEKPLAVPFAEAPAIEVTRAGRATH